MPTKTADAPHQRQQETQCLIPLVGDRCSKGALIWMVEILFLAPHQPLQAPPQSNTTPDCAQYLEAIYHQSSDALPLHYDHTRVWSFKPALGKTSLQCVSTSRLILGANMRKAARLGSSPKLLVQVNILRNLVHFNSSVAEQLLCRHAACWSYFGFREAGAESRPRMVNAAYSLWPPDRFAIFGCFPKSLHIQNAPEQPERKNGKVNSLGKEVGIVLLREFNASGTRL